jgi:UDP-glucose 4-epimerase
MKTILVVGGAGYIGSHCVKILYKKGFKVISYDNLSRGFRDAVMVGEFVEGDIGDPKRLKDLFSSHPIDAVMHFAAYAYVGESVKKPEMYMENNFKKTKVLLDAMVEHDILSFIFSSTCAVYGIPKEIPIPENHPRKPVSPYGESKMLVEDMLAQYDGKYGLKSVSFRYFNAAGCDPEGELGERHHPETHLIPLALRAALGTGRPLSIFGTDYDTQDGTCIRDYIHVNDLSEAHILGLEYLFNQKKSELFNLGNGNGFSVKEIVRTVEEVTGRQVPCQETPRRAGDPPVLIGNAQKAIGTLNWRTAYGRIEDIIGTAFLWEKKSAG